MRRLLLFAGLCLLAMPSCSDDALFFPFDANSDAIGGDGGLDVATDGGVLPDGAEADADVSDGEVPDTGADAADGGPADSGPADGGPADGGPADGGPADGGPADGGPADGGPADGGPADGGPEDGGPEDGGPPDTDAQAPDVGPENGCAQFVPTEVDFGSVPEEGTVVRTVRVENCAPPGGPNVRVSGAAMSGRDASSFSIVFDFFLPTEIEPGGSLEGDLRFFGDEEEAVATVQVETSVGTLNAPVFASRSGASPQLQGGCNVTSESSLLESTTVSLPDGVFCAHSTFGLTDIEWSMASRPTGSLAEVLGVGRGRAPVVLDLPGTYVIELRGTLDGEAVSDSYEINATVTPTPGLVVAIYWDDQTIDPLVEGFGSASDVDLHLLNTSLGCWNDTPADCHFLNPTPEWGAFGEADNPELLADDSAGYGPEVIRVPELEPLIFYEVGVELFDTHGFGPVTVYVLVYDNGVLRLFEERALGDTNRSWSVVAQLTNAFAANLVVPLSGAVSTTVPECSSVPAP